MDVCVTLATGTAERDAAVAMLQQKPPGKRVTLGADRAYDTQGFVEQMRSLQVTHTWRRTTRTAVVQLMAGQPGMKVMR